MKLNSRYRYMIGIDYQTSQGSSRPAKQVQQFLDKFEGDIVWAEDLRMPMITQVTGNIDNIEMLKNYSVLYAITHSEYDTTINLHLDFGLVPVCFYPTPLMDLDILIKGVIRNLGLTPYDVQATYPSGMYGIRTHYDTWVSRLEIASYFKIKPENIKMTQIFNEVIKCV